jgi:hypothetical protein
VAQRTLTVHLTGTSQDLQRAFRDAERSANDLGANLRIVQREAKTTSRSLDDGSRSANEHSRSLTGLGREFERSSIAMKRFQGIVGQLKLPAAAVAIGGLAQAASAASAGVVALASSLAPLGGALAAYPALASTVAQGFGVFKLATFGVADALKALQAESNDAKTAATSSAQAQAAAADQVASAEQSLRQAHDGERAAQQALTQARRDAARQLVSLGDAALAAGDAEKSAQLALREARLNEARVNANFKSTSLERERAALDVVQAEHGLTAAHHEARAAQEDANRAERRGVEGSQQVIQARRGVTSAHDAVTSAIRALAAAQRQATAATPQQTTPQRKLQDALKALSPAARTFVKDIWALKPAFDALRNTAAENFFPGVTRGLQSARRSFSGLDRIVGRTATAMGDFAEQVGGLVGSRRFGRDLVVQGDRNVRWMRDAGHVSLNLARALEDVTIAAGPLVNWMVRGARAASDWVAREVRLARESGRLAGFFDETRVAMSRVVRIGVDLAGAFVNIARAGKPLGDDILVNLVKSANAFREWTSSARGRNALAEYFDRARPSIMELGRLIRDADKAFFRLGAGDGLAPLLRMVRTRLLPAFERVASTTTKALGPPLIEALATMAETFERLGGANGPLVGFVKLLTTSLKVLNALLDTVPGLNTAVVSVLGVAGLYKALGIASALTGVGKLRSALRGAGREAAAVKIGGGGSTVPQTVTQRLTGATPAARAPTVRGAFTAARTAGGLGAGVRAGAGIAARGVGAAALGAFGGPVGLGLSAALIFGPSLISALKGPTKTVSDMFDETDKKARKVAGGSLPRYAEELRRSAREARRFGADGRQVADALTEQARRIENAFGRRWSGEIGRSWRDFRRSGASSLQALQDQVDRTTATIRDRLGTNTAAGRKAAVQNFAEMAKSITARVKEGSLSTETATKQINRNLVNTDQGRKAASEVFRKLAAAARDRMSEAERATDRGQRKINALLEKALEALGLNKAQARAKVTTGTIQTDRNLGSDRQGNPVAGHTGGPVRGGYIRRAGGGWIGRRGMVSGDVVPLPESRALVAFGEYDAVAPGGRRAILNRHQAPVAEAMLRVGGHGTLDTLPPGRQLPIIERAMRPIGGLDALFSAIQRPHNMAGGGYAKGGRGAGGSAIVAVPGFPGERAAQSVIGMITAIARRFHLTLTDAFGPGHQSPGHTRYGTAADFGGPDASMDRAVRYLVRQGYLVGYDGRFGSQRWPGHGPTSVAGSNAHLHVELGTKGARGVAGGAAAAVTARIRGVRTDLRGGPGALANRAMTLMTGAANRRLRRIAGREAEVPVAGGGTGSGNVIKDFRRALRDARATPIERLALFEAGIVESGLRNLPYGDRDSVGALQQRPSAGWKGLRDPYRAAREFLAHARRLRPFRGSAGQLAQAIQVSAYPGRYDAARTQASKYAARGGRFQTGGRLRRLQAAMDTAGTTRTKEDDRRAAQALVSYWRGELAAARGSGKPSRISDAAQNLAQAQGQLADLEPEKFTRMERLESRQSLAQLTKGTDDDYQVARQMVREATRTLARARKRGNVGRIQDAADTLTQAREQARGLRPARRPFVPVSEALIRAYEPTLDYADALAQGTPGTGDDERIRQTRYNVAQQRLTNVAASLMNPNLKPKRRQRLLAQATEYRNQMNQFQAPAPGTAPLPDDIRIETAKASLTADTGDDRTALERQRGFYQDQYNQALGSGNADAIEQAASNLKGVVDSLDSLGSTFQQVMEENTAAIKESNENAKKALAISQALQTSQGGQILRAVTDFVSGQIAGPAYLGAQTPFTPGVRVRY